MKVRDIRAENEVRREALTIALSKLSRIQALVEQAEASRDAADDGPGWTVVIPVEKLRAILGGGEPRVRPAP